MLQKRSLRVRCVAQWQITRRASIHEVLASSFTKTKNRTLVQLGKLSLLRKFLVVHCPSISVRPVKDDICNIVPYLKSLKIISIVSSLEFLVFPRISLDCSSLGNATYAHLTMCFLT